MPAMRICLSILAGGNVGGTFSQYHLTDGKYTKPNSYGALLFDNTHYSIVSVYKPVNITFSSCYYSDSGGTSGKSINVYRLDENKKYTFYCTIQQVNNSIKYATQYFPKGIYKWGPPARYVEFSEWDYEVVQ